MATEVNEIALDKWAAGDLEVAAGPDGSLECRFSYEGRTCRENGDRYDATICAVLTPEPDSRWRIADVRIEIDGSASGWLATCIHESSRDGDPATLAKYSSARGMLLDEFLTRAWAVDAAPCFCTSVHVNHKLLVALAAVHHRLKNGHLPTKSLP